METAPQLQGNWKQSDPNPVSLLLSPSERLSLHVIVLHRREKMKEKNQANERAGGPGSCWLAVNTVGKIRLLFPPALTEPPSSMRLSPLHVYIFLLTRSGRNLQRFVWIWKSQQNVSFTNQGSFCGGMYSPGPNHSPHTSYLFQFLQQLLLSKQLSLNTRDGSPFSSFCLASYMWYFHLIDHMKFKYFPDGTREYRTL